MTDWRSDYDRAGDDLAKSLRNYPWYHRTTLSYEQGRGDFLTVWVEGQDHPEIPTEFRGYHVQINRVTREHPCPFGSVKPHPREGWGNTV